MAALLVLLPARLAFAQDQRVTVDSIPASIDSYLHLRDSLARTPEGGAAMLLIAMLEMKKDPGLGLQMMTVMLDRSLLRQGGTYKGFTPSASVMFHVDRLSRDDAWRYLPSAYVEGTTPADGYACEPPYTYLFSRNAYSGSESKGSVKVFIRTYGVMPRPVMMKVNSNGIWKPAEISSLFVDVARPAADTKDDL